MGGSGKSLMLSCDDDEGIPPPVHQAGSFRTQEGERTGVLFGWGQGYVIYSIQPL